MHKVKIVATIGPASSNPETIGRMIEAGLDVVRLNFSHGEHDEHRRVFDMVREAAERSGEQIAILADLCGPKIRVGTIAGGAATISAGDELTITTEEVEGDASRVSTSYQALPGDVGPGDRILIDDGLIELSVSSVEGSEVHCRVIEGGVLKDRKGLNIPGTPLSTPALTVKDREDLAFARELGVDYFALSFVRDPKDVLEAKELAGETPVIAKIEKPEAVSRLDEIIAVSDGLMVARGDLAVEAGAEKVPLIQKRLIRDAGIRGIPVIVATQMLESMIHNPRPTRAEVSDVANAVLDGTDAVMLSGESAVGRDPVAAVREMAAIIDEVEKSEIYRQRPRPVRVEEYSFSNAIARAALTVSSELKLKTMVVYTETGHSADLTSSCRPRARLVAISRHREVLRRLALRWGVIPLLGETVVEVSEAVNQAESMLLNHELAEPGQDIAVTFGMQDMNGPGRTDVLKLWRLRDGGS